MEKSEYELQHFQFTAEQISLERRHILSKILPDFLEDITKRVTTSPEITAMLTEKKQDVVQRMLLVLEEDLKALDALDQKTFSIPDHVLLQSDFDYIRNYTEDDVRQLGESVAEMKHQILENSVMIQLLKSELDQYAVIESFAEDELKVHEEVKKSLNAVQVDKLERIVLTTKEFLERTHL